jgi:hypothetical protein
MKRAKGAGGKKSKRSLWRKEASFHHVDATTGKSGYKKK